MRELLFIACCVFAISGCASMPSADSFKLSNPFSKKDKVPEPYPNPVKLGTTWTSDTLTAPGKTPTRGFGGRVFFYNEKSQTVPVDGQLLVVAYEESGIPGVPPRVRRFGFTREQFTKHYSQSDFGASYSFWLPWDADGQPQQRVTLVPSFTTAAGNVIQGQPTSVLLPGPDGEEFVRAADMPLRSRRYGGQQPPYVPPMGEQPPVQQTGYAGLPGEVGFESEAAQRPRSGLTTTTIPAPSSFNRRPTR